MSDPHAHASADECAPSWPQITASTLLLIIVLISSVLQLSPFPGIYLMFFLAAFWPIFLINSAMMFMIAEVFVKSQPAFMVVVPLVYFCGYFIAVVMGHYYQSKLAPIVIINRQIGFVRPSDAIYVDDIQGFDPVEFLRRYRNSIVIVSGPHDTGDGSGTRIYETTDKAACDVADVAHVEIIYRSHGPDEECISKSPTRPEQPDSSVFVGLKTIEPQTAVKYALQIRIDEVYVARSTFSGSFVIEHRPIPLYWFPLPYFGCILIDNPSGWKCQGGFMFDESDARREDLTDRIAEGMGLERRPAEL